MAASDSFYEELIIEVDEVIDELGTTFTVRGQGVYDPDTRVTSDGATRLVTGLVADQTMVASFNFGAGSVPEQDSNWIGKKNLILKAQAAPLPKEEVLVDGEWFPLSKITSVKPADIILLYILDITK